MTLRFALMLALLALPSPAPACSICNSVQAKTLRQDAGDARMVLFGTLIRSELNKDGVGGTTDFQIEKVIKPDPFLGNRKVIQLPRYVPINAKEPPRFLIFCDIFKERIDPYRGMQLKSEGVVEYLQGALALDPRDTQSALLHFFKYVDHREPEIAQDAFLELAKASDRDLGEVARKFPSEKIRSWVQDEQTPTDRLNLFGFLLGACGTDRDAAVLRSFLDKPNERTQSAFQGVLCGYIQLRPKEGWDLVHELLAEGKKPFEIRFAVLRSVRFYHGWKPEETRRDVLRALGLALEKGDVADLAIEDLRRWQYWDLTPAVLAQFEKKSHDIPIVQRTIVRYALTCPDAEARKFIEALRKQDAFLVKDVEESLQFEKQK